jgi:hypothetical protein
VARCGKELGDYGLWVKDGVAGDSILDNSNGQKKYLIEE